MTDLTPIGVRAKQAAAVLATLPGGAKNRALAAIADDLEAQAQAILTANARDMAAAQSNGIGPAMQDRLLLTEERIAAIAGAVRQVAAQEDPVGKVLEGATHPNGMRITKVTVPLGVVGVIYESRPNVTVDCAVLCLKSGNACILRGGKEAIHSNIALVQIIRGALERTGLKADFVQLIEDTDRSTATALMRMNGVVDLLFPRGGKGLIRSVVENATVPVVETGAGNCHLYVDRTADLEMAAAVLDNAKTSRPSVCNAVETLLVHREAAGAFLPIAAARLAHAAVELRGCPRAMKILGGGAKPAEEADWEAEYDDYILAVRVVDNLEEAIAHIERYSTHHSEAILTNDYRAARQFTAQVNSAAVYVNASTRFTDGGEFGLGAEIGISTQKLHARGPMGLGHMTSYKYIIHGDGQIR